MTGRTVFHCVISIVGSFVQTKIDFVRPDFFVRFATNWSYLGQERVTKQHCKWTTLQMICWCPPPSMCGEGGFVCRLFRHPATKPQIQKWEAEGHELRFSPSSKCNYWKNHINNFLKELAKMWGYSNYQHYTTHSNRWAGLSNTANFGVSPAVLMQMGEHLATNIISQTRQLTTLLSVQNMVILNPFANRLDFPSLGLQQ